MEAEWEDKAKHCLQRADSSPCISAWFPNPPLRVWTERQPHQNGVVRQYQGRLPMLGCVFWLHSYKKLFKAVGATFFFLFFFFLSHGRDLYVWFLFLLNDIMAKINASSVFLGGFNVISKHCPNLRTCPSLWLGKGTLGAESSGSARPHGFWASTCRGKVTPACGDESKEEGRCYLWPQTHLLQFSPWLQMS